MHDALERSIPREQDDRDLHCMMQGRQKELAAELQAWAEAEDMCCSLSLKSSYQRNREVVRAQAQVQGLHGPSERIDARGVAEGHGHSAPPIPRSIPRLMLLAEEALDVGVDDGSQPVREISGGVKGGSFSTLLEVLLYVGDDWRFLV